MSTREPHVVTGAAGTTLTVIAPVAATSAAVIVIQEIWGVSDHLLAQAKSLAEHGFLAVVPHLYHRVGDPVIDQGNFPAAKSLLGGLQSAEIGADINDAVKFARGAGAAAVGTVGFCMGGTIALWTAARAAVDAAVTFYGSGIETARWPGIPPGLELAPEVRVPWLGLYGDLDRSIPSSQVEDLRTALAGRPVPTDIIRYPMAGHAFATDPGSPSYLESAARDGWARAITWLETHLF